MSGPTTRAVTIETITCPLMQSIIQNSFSISCGASMTFMWLRRAQEKWRERSGEMRERLVACSNQNDEWDAQQKEFALMWEHYFSPPKYNVKSCLTPPGVIHLNQTKPNQKKKSKWFCCQCFLTYLTRSYESRGNINKEVSCIDNKIIFHWKEEIIKIKAYFLCVGTAGLVMLLWHVRRDTGTQTLYCAALFWSTRVLQFRPESE